MQIALHAYGGTIAQIEDKEGALRPPKSPAEFKKLISSHIKPFEDQADFHIDCPVMIDSTNTRAVHWEFLIHKLYQQQADVDAFIVTFGTDTLASCAHAIQLATHKDFYRPIIITGSQHPLSNPGGDAVMNIVSAIKLAQHLVALKDKGQYLVGALVAFGQRYINASTVAKVSGRRIQGFDAPILQDERLNIKFKPGVIGHVDGGAPMIDTSLYCQKRIVSEKKFLDIIDGTKEQTKPSCNQFITHAPIDFFDEDKGTKGADMYSLDFQADMSPNSLKPIIHHPQTLAIFLRGVGEGHIASRWHQVLQEAIREGIAVFVQSPFFDGRAGVSPYGIAKDLEEIGVMPTFGMTHSMAMVKAKWLVATGQAKTVQSLTQKLIVNVADEVLLSKEEQLKVDEIIQRSQQVREQDRVKQLQPEIQVAQQLWCEYLQQKNIRKALGFL